MKPVCNLLKNIPIMTVLVLILIPALSHADPGNQYCITPPFITAGIKPNLLLMIDNSASMYDLAYQDTANKYCANAPTTACTADTQCSGAGQAYCVGSYATTADTTTKAACNTDADCQTILAGDTCVLTGPKSGRNLCKAATVHTLATVSPIACTTDSQCTSGTCPAGTTCTWASSDTCNNKCSASRQCYDTTYTPYTSTVNYNGYFDATATYSYDFTNNKFTSVANMPGTCTYSAGTPTYFCVNTTGTGTAETVTTNSTGFVASGNFLNWLTTSKFDQEKMVLTGGKFDTTNNVLVAESRGCGGREFLKAVPGVNLTFSIRGGTLGGIGTTQSLATEYGQTYIEIYSGVYNAAACLSSMNDWINIVSGTSPNLGSFQNDTKSCVGSGSTALNPTSMWNHSLHNCFQGMTGGAGGYSTNLGPLEGECQAVYSTFLPSKLTDQKSGFSVCSSVLTYTIGGTSYTGYLGACWNGTDFTGPCKDSLGNPQPDALTQMQNYCKVNVTTNPIADPSSTAVINNVTSASIPGFVMQQGLTNLTLVGTMTVKVGLATPPTGLIDKYNNSIRFGAMTFQNNGSGSECGTATFPCAKACYSTSTGFTTRMCYASTDCPTGTGQTCELLPQTDGGKIISYVGGGNCSVTTTTACSVDSDCASLTPTGQYCQPVTGSHSSGLIKNIDDIQATSWTPFAEAFYNAMGYFARLNAYTVSPPTSRSDASFTALPAPNTATSYDDNKNPSQYRCQSNNVLLITDGMSTADQNSASEGLATLYASQVPYTYTIGGTQYTPGATGYDAANVHGATTSCPPYSGSRSISTLAWVAKNRNIKTLVTSVPASTTSPQSSSESITTYVVYSGPQTSSQPGLCDPKTLMANTATNGGTTLFSVTTPAALLNQLDAALSTVAAKAASGTAASILSNSEGSGANILQAVFYPKKIFDESTSVNWIGEMQNLWYFVDPYIQNSTIREDTDSDLNLILDKDYVVRFNFDSSSDKTMVQRYKDSDGDGIVTDSDKVGGLIDPDYVKSIWRAGMKLWTRNDDATKSPNDPRTIYTGFHSFADSTPQKFSNLAIDGYLNTWPSFWNALQIPAGTDVQRQALATSLISYIRGTDQPDDTAPCLNADCKYRGRTVTMGVCSNNSQMRCTAATDCPSGGSCSSSSHEWKLGDIISSTPRVQSTVRLNTYNLPSPGGYSDKSYQSFINSNDYKGRGMVYVGANDGMLHAFNLGVLSVKANGFLKATLDVPTGTTLGAEQWAFIPMNSLPYLKYVSDNNYSHLYYVDGRTVILDASIGDTNSGSCVRSSYWNCDKPSNGSIPIVDSGNNLNASNTWRTVVIGGMGLGGASRNNVGTETCTEGATGNCVKTPISDYGYSSYFALDVTYPNSPKFLWEFSNNQLGFATTAPAIVRIGDKGKNGRWFAVFGNGPFGPIDPGTHQFKAQSNQNLRFFVVDLRTGDLVRTISFDGTGNEPNIANAFAGTLLGASIDTDRRYPTRVGNYQDDAIYAGYVKLGSDGKWSDGGVVRIMTKEDQNPANWVGSKVIEGIGPVTTAIARTQDTRDISKNLWLYFGTGRYFYRDATTLDDNINSRSLFGIQEPCYNTTSVPGNVLDGNCTDNFDTGLLANQTSSISSLGSNKGWQIDLDAATTSEGAERVVTDTVALPNGTVFFTSFKPTMDVCGYGGNSYLWGVKYDTGGQAAANALKGKALIQLSTGEFKEVDLSTAFTDKLNRRMLTPMTGKPPSDAPPIISNSSNKPVKKILHIQEH